MQKIEKNDCSANSQGHSMQRGVVLTLVALAVAVALIPSLPYGYYSVMRWFVFASCAWLAVRAGHGYGELSLASTTH